ncbi:MAG: site-2 protease family protein [Myxococcota bacterium]|nr:site-2 protease family protein [Myxococcota bacterium]
MKWSIRIGSVAGIGVYVHATFAILIAWIAAASWSRGGTLFAVFDGVAFVLALFACIVLHELGHALAARRYDIRTRDITLLPIGGLARLERMPEEPAQELVVALAGPAVNLLIAAVLWVALGFGAGFDPEAVTSAFEGPFLQRLLIVNVAIMLFNLLPAFPMDGGRALRAVLATRMDYVAATQRAAHIGQAMALGFGLLGLLANPFLLFIALFVWIGAAAEASMVQIKSALGGIPVDRAMLRDFAWLAPGEPLSRAVEMTLAGSQKDFPVIEAGRVRGVLTQERLLAGLTESGPNAPVDSVLETESGEADSHEMLEAALARLEESGSRTMPVTHDGRVVGLLTLDNVGELLRIESALEGYVGRHPRASGR